jgi:hypothetical protein
MSTTVQIRGQQTISAMSVVAMLTVLGLAGCGGGGGSSGPTLTRAEYLTQANAICSTTARRISDAIPTVFPNPNQAGEQDAALVTKFADTVVLPQLQKEYDDLRALRPQADDNPTHTLGELEKAIDRWEIDKTLLSVTADKSFARFDMMANDFGLTSCTKTDGMVHAVAAGQLGTSS